MKQISMWSGPRNISTAMMYAFHHRGDCQVVDEPFYAYYLKKSGADHPGREEILAHHEQDAVAVKKWISNQPQEKPLFFMKNMPHHMVDVDMEFVKQFDNFFLIREPRAMILSYIEKIPEPSMRDFGLDLQFTLFEQLRSLGENPIVVDSHTLLQNPEGVMRKLCDRLAIEYSPSMITWPAGAIAEDGIWAKHWYTNVHKSTGFVTAKTRDVSLFPYEIEELAQDCERYYRAMKKFELTA